MHVSSPSPILIPMRSVSNKPCIYLPWSDQHAHSRFSGLLTLISLNFEHPKTLSIFLSRSHHTVGTSLSCLTYPILIFYVILLSLCTMLYAYISKYTHASQQNIYFASLLQYALESDFIPWPTPCNSNSYKHRFCSYHIWDSKLIRTVISCLFNEKLAGSRYTTTSIRVCYQSALIIMYYRC